MASWVDRVLGDRDRLGWWTLPVFVATGLAGAVLAGTIAAVYYGQQVDALEDETRASRQELQAAVDRVAEAREEALDEIEGEVESVRETLSRALPVEDAGAIGLALLRTFPDAAPAPDQQGAAVGEVRPLAAQDPPAEQPPAEQPQQPAPRERGAPRIGSAFAVVRAEGTIFFATSYSLVRDDDGPRGVVEDLELVTGEGTFVATVHNWDAAMDVALVAANIRADIGEWLPEEEGVEVGERVFSVGLTPSLNLAQVAATVVATEPRSLLTDLAPLPVTTGGPVVDADGRVVAISTAAYRPYGPNGGTAFAPIRVLCEQLIRCTEQTGTGE